MSSWWDAVRSWFRKGRQGGFPEPDPDQVQHFTGREDWIRGRKNLPTARNSREISEELDAKIRAQAFFSARVAEGHILDRLREVSDAFTRGEIGQAEARTRLKEFLVSQGYDPQDGSLTNLPSTSRLNLILEQNARMAYAVGRWQEGMDPDIKERFPCWRYVGSTALSPRDSHARYAGHVYAKDDPVWHRIFPPSDFGCKCSVEDCDAPPEKAPKEITPPESGFAFDPAHAFEKFDYDAIKDAELREKTRDGVERILGTGSPTGPTSQTNPANVPETIPETEHGKEPPKPAETHKEHLARRKEQLVRARENRFKREAELLGGAKAIEGKHTRRQDLKNTNPSYFPGPGPYGENCQRCIAAYEARRRGYDVTAKPFLGDDSISIGEGWTRPFKNGRIIDCSSNSGMESKAKILEAMKGMPDGARCGVKIMLTEYNGHVFIAEKVGDKIEFVDPQSGKKDVSYYFSGATGEYISIMRLDNLKFTAMVEKCCDVGA